MNKYLLPFFAIVIGLIIAFVTKKQKTIVSLFSQEKDNTDLKFLSIPQVTTEAKCF